MATSAKFRIQVLWVPQVAGRDAHWGVAARLCAVPHDSLWRDCGALHRPHVRQPACRRRQPELERGARVSYPLLPFPAALIHAPLRQGELGVFFDMNTCTCEYFDSDTQEPKSKAKVRSLPRHSVCARCCALTVGRVAQGGVRACLIVKANTTSRSLHLAALERFFSICKLEKTGNQRPITWGDGRCSIYTARGTQPRAWARAPWRKQGDTSLQGPRARNARASLRFFKTRAWHLAFRAPDAFSASRWLRRAFFLTLEPCTLSKWVRVPRPSHAS